MATPPELDLTRRTGLPDALRVLVEDLPREVWEVHPEFGALTRFWLDRHLGFRRLLATLTADAQALVDRSRAAEVLVPRLARGGQMLLSELSMHHRIEDAHYFPVLAGLEAKVAAGFDLLDADHHALDERLHALVDAFNRVIRAAGVPADLHEGAGVLEGGLAGLAGLLGRHLTDEEELVVPVILRHGEGALPH